MTEPELPRSGHHELEISEVIAETADARSITFAVPAELRDRFRYRPGQFLTLSLPETQARCYSLCSAPHEEGILRVTVKRVTDGYGSNWLCDNAEIGMRIAVLPPAGRFTPRSLDDDLLLFAGGSGITPMMSIVKTLLHKATGSVVLIYANRDERSVIFSAELDALSRQYPDRLQVVHWLESVQGLPNTEQLRTLAASFTDRTAFLCGPVPFMDATAQALKELDMPREKIHVERFVSLSGNPFQQIEEAEASTEDTTELSVSLDGQKHEFRWPRNKKMLDFLLEKGLDAPYSCREGQCSACAYVLLSGEVRLLHNEILEAEDLSDGLRLGCQSVADTDEVSISYDE